MSSIQRAYDALKHVAESISSSSVSLWVVNRNLKYKVGEASYKVNRVDTTGEINRKLVDILKRAATREGRFRQYEYETTDIDDDGGLAIDVSETDFGKIKNEIISGYQAHALTATQDQMNKPWSYVIHSYSLNTSECIFTFNHLGGVWNINRDKKQINGIWNGQVFELESENKRTLGIDFMVDLISYGDTLFIFRKKGFEDGLNFREGMIRNRENLIKSLAESKHFSGVDVIRQKTSATSMGDLRKISSIVKNGFYSDPRFLENLVKAIKQHPSWGVEITQEGTIRITEENLLTVMSLLNDNRLISEVTDTEYDVSVKKKISE